MKPNEMTDEELNEAMAVEVMGLEIDAKGWVYTHPLKDAGFMARSWHPTHDLNQVWECVEHWLKECGEWDFGIYRSWKNDILYWEAWLTNELGAEVNIEATNIDPARAICEALLMAVRSER